MEQQTHEELHRFTVTERFQPSMLLQAFEPNIVKDKSKRQPSLILIPKFQQFFQEKLRPNYLGDVSSLVNRLYFKSNYGKVSLCDESEVLSFDPVEVPE